MAEYRKKPVVIDAFQWDGSDECLESVYRELKTGRIARDTNHLYIKTLEGDMTANLGDYIIKGIKGEFYPIKPDIFHKTYEKVPKPMTLYPNEGGNTE